MWMISLWGLRVTAVRTTTIASSLNTWLTDGQGRAEVLTDKACPWKEIEVADPMCCFLNVLGTLRSLLKFFLNIRRRNLVTIIQDLKIVEQ